MSTSALIYGKVTLDAAARAALEQTPTWQWADPREAAADGSPFVTERADGFLVIDFGGEGYRNLSRHVEHDLASAAQLGSVEGEVTVECSDGEFYRNVTVYEAGQIVHGVGECFWRPVVGYLSRSTTYRDLLTEQGVSLGTKEKGSEDAELPSMAVQLLGDLRAFVPVEGCSPRLLFGSPTRGWCECGPYDEVTDQPTCLTRHAVALAL